MAKEPRPLPSDGLQDNKPWVRCRSCGKLRPCYRGPLEKVVETEAGDFEHWRWLCVPCFQSQVDTALHQP